MRSDEQKNMIKSFVFAPFFLFFTSCYSFAQNPAPNDILITLERNRGYWGSVGAAPCPFYKLAIFKDGSVELGPKDFVEYRIVVGKTIKNKISKKQIEMLVSEFKKIDFYSVNSTFENQPNREDCPSYGTDDVTAITSITLDGKTHHVEHYHGCHGTEALSKLNDLENKIDEVVNIKQWFDCRDGKNRIVLSGSNKKN